MFENKECHVNALAIKYLGCKFNPKFYFQYIKMSLPYYPIVCLNSSEIPTCFPTKYYFFVILSNVLYMVFVI